MRPLTSPFRVGSTRPKIPTQEGIMQAEKQRIIRATAKEAMVEVLEGFRTVLDNHAQFETWLQEHGRTA
jgi:hypothetical protein